MRRRKTIKVDVKLLETWVAYLNHIADRIGPLERGDITASIDIAGEWPTEVLRSIASSIHTTVKSGLEPKKQVSKGDVS